MTPPEGSTSFLVNYSMPGKQPASVPVQVIKEDGGMFSADTFRVSPNPVVAELRPIGPPPKPGQADAPQAQEARSRGDGPGCHRLSVPRPRPGCPAPALTAAHCTRDSCEWIGTACCRIVLDAQRA